MSGVRARGEDIRRHILESVGKTDLSLVNSTAEKFGISRQAVNKHLRRLVSEGTLTQAGNTRNRNYRLAPKHEWRGVYSLKGDAPILAEDVVWAKDIKAVLGPLPDNVVKIWYHGFTEIFNNAIDHSESEDIRVRITKDAVATRMQISDSGVGIFKKIQNALGLLDERHAVLELAKGKFTTDPKNHSGEGIFFSSRMFDDFAIVSGGVVFTHEYGVKEDWIHQADTDHKGTHVFMRLNNHTARTTKKVIDQFSSDEDYTFSKTVVPVALAKYGDDNLISRSQAKRVLARIELFKVVLLDFSNVPSIGQAFADEIFRVFTNEHPDIQLVPRHANQEVRKMIDRVKNTVHASSLRHRKT